VQHISDYGHLVSAPLCLFEVVDSTASRYWQLRVRDDGTVTLWPASFYREYFHDDLSEGVLEVSQEFAQARKLIESEAIGRVDSTSAASNQYHAEKDEGQIR
jgi:hypothetical protein